VLSRTATARSSARVLRSRRGDQGLDRTRLRTHAQRALRIASAALAHLQNEAGAEFSRFAGLAHGLNLLGNARRVKPNLHIVFVGEHGLLGVRGARLRWRFARAIQIRLRQFNSHFTSDVANAHLCERSRVAARPSRARRCVARSSRSICRSLGSPGFGIGTRLGTSIRLAAG
jgi:hypothetical protein